MQIKLPNRQHYHPTLLNLDRSRRRFVQGLIGGGVLGSFGWSRQLGATTDSLLNTNRAEVLSGKEFNLVIEDLPVNFTGNLRIGRAINGSIPAPTLRWVEGDDIVINVTNRTTEPTALHWHGIILPYQMDGVPGISFNGIAPNETFQYRFRVQQSGTYWYHAHFGFQEMRGMYGAIVVQPRAGETIKTDRDHVILLSDWTDENPDYAFAKLKTKGHLYNFNQPTFPQLLREIARDGLGSAISKREMFDVMRMKPTDLADLSAATLTYLMNGTTPASNATSLFAKGETVRLRVINGAGNTFFDFRIPDLPMTVVQVDGVDVEPVTCDEFRCAPGETCDVVVRPTEDAYTIFAETMERTGYARGTLALRAGLSAAIPPQREPQWLSMVDMMGTGSHESGMAATGDHASHSMPAVNQPLARHASSEFGPSTDMRVDTPRTNLDDPGIGLREATHRVLTYADLHRLQGEVDVRDPGREIELHLTGNMERYSWSVDGLEYGKSTPVHFRHGERLRVILHNDTMMTHPLHLHGMWSDLEDENGNFMTRKHILSVQPAQRMAFRVTADALGRWAWHCHLLFHMEAGMMREVVVS